MTTKHYELTEFLKNYVLEYGNFKLRSGKQSHYYIDGKKITHSPHGLLLTSKAIVEELEDRNVTAIGGIELGATPIACAYATLSSIVKRPVNGFTVRKQIKEHGTQKLIEGKPPDSQSRVVIIDDVVTTGKSILDAVKVVENIGCQIEAAISIVDREEEARENIEKKNIQYLPLVTATDLEVQENQKNH